MGPANLVEGNVIWEINSELAASSRNSDEISFIPEGGLFEQ